MWSAILISLPVLLVIDAVVVWAVRRRAVAQMEAQGKRDEVVEGINRTMSFYLAAMFVVLFTVYFFWLRNAWQGFAITVIVGIINSLMTFTLFALMGRQ